MWLSFYNSVQFNNLNRKPRSQSIYCKISRVQAQRLRAEIVIPSRPFVLALRGARILTKMVANSGCRIPIEFPEPRCYYFEDLIIEPLARGSLFCHFAIFLK
jgi:hypothetical protein